MQRYASPINFFYYYSNLLSYFLKCDSSVCFMRMGKAKALLITCMDYRFVDSFYKEAEQLGIDHSYDRVAVAGDIKNIVSPARPEDRELILRQIEISEELHHIDEVVIISHQNCGAYPELAELDEDKEMEAHTNDLKAARIVIGERFPSISVRLLFARLHEGDHGRVIDFVEIENG